MKTANENVRMAYALGCATCEKETGEDRTIDLKKVNSDWEGYVLIGFGMSGKHNNSYDLWYNGDFGSEEKYVRIMKICEGWELNHTIALLTNAIQMHKAEMKNKT